MNKKVLCVSWCDADPVMNYGQILQGCAMMHIIRKYNTGDIYYISYTKRGIKNKVRYYLKHYNPINGHLFSYVKTRKVIKDFATKNNVSFYQVMNASIVEQLANNADIMMCGSDQIWHPINYNKVYFLNFGPSRAKRIAFAASLPKSRIEESFVDEYQHIRKNLQEFDAIAVREVSSVPLINELSGKKVISVLDPTFLVESSIWEQYIEDMNISEKFLFVYIPNGMDRVMAEYIDSIREKTKIAKVYVMITRGENIVSNSITLRFISLGQFLYFIKNANTVLTSSFHAIVFSTIFHTDFWAYDVPNEIRGEDLRITDLLKLLQLDDRNFSSFISTVSYKGIDFDQVDRILVQKQKESYEFLDEQLCD